MRDPFYDSYLQEGNPWDDEDLTEEELQEREDKRLDAIWDRSEDYKN